MKYQIKTVLVLGVFFLLSVLCTVLKERALRNTWLKETTHIRLDVLPEDALCLSSTQSENVLGKLNLHPGQFPVWEEFTLPLHHLLQRTAEKGGSDNSPSAVVDLLQSGLT